MSDNWTIKVDDQIYGPYTDAEMHDFSVEGRLAPYSLVAREGETDFRTAKDEATLAHLFAGLAEMAEKAEPAEDAAQELIRYLIVADMKSRSIAGLEREIHMHGTALSLAPQSWLLIAAIPLNQLRDRLMEQLGNPDHLFIADTTHNKGIWVNYGLEKESQIRQAWLKA